MVRFCLPASLLVFACAEPPLEPRDPTPGMFDMTIGSFNVEFTDASDDSTGSAVGASDADVMMLQETTPSWEVVIRDVYSDRYPFMEFRNLSETSSGGLAVLSRYPLTDLGYHKGPNGWHPAWHIL